jgi:predicted nucleotidyltransferase
MHATEYPHVDELVRELLSRLQALLGDALAGVCLHGSLVAGDFDENLSDIDLLVVTSSDLDEGQLGSLERMHADFARAHPKWDDRIEAVYMSAAALQSFKERSSRLAVVSPGEPFHTMETKDFEFWTLKWYLAREQGVALFGPSPETLIPTVTQDEFVSGVRAHLQRWPEWITESGKRKFHGYAVVTVCRGLYSWKHGQQASKRRAAEWAAREYPEWSSLVWDAVKWREESSDEEVNDETRLQTASFIQFAVQEIAK